ncbi:MAG: cyclic nucleotide-binding domain-containing protein [Nevskiaceae bacterium]|nr:MAG: cyclic nucleotide-binding domain-containing protein [Nevskiaceae bacterium]TBR71622.1 MAG: cyclic nucleotide-binding domain-containing protein [Nevskiaceae bacterium]
MSASGFLTQRSNMAQTLLSSIYLFSQLTDPELEQVNAIAQTRHFAGSERIFDQGDGAEALYVIKFGSVQIRYSSKDDDSAMVLRTLGSGAHFGEMSFIENAKRSASATALEASELVIIEYARLERLLNAEPLIAVKFYRSVARYLSGRLRRTTTDLGFARDRNRRDG